MGEVKAEIRKQDAKVSEQTAIIDEQRAENRRLKKEVERLEKDRRNNSAHSKRNNSRNTATRNGVIHNVEATAYTAFCPTGCIGITKTGLDVRNTIYAPDGYRVIAVDPSIIPLGSTVRVTLANGDSFVAKAEDTGGDIKGARIDVLVGDEATAYKLGRQAATVEVLSK